MTTTVESKKFSDMSADEQAIAVAQDVIDRLKAKKFTAAGEGGLGSTYIEIDNESWHSIDYICKFAESDRKDCEACALGAMTMSKLILDECSEDKKCDSERSINRGFCVERLEGIFTKNELYCIEEVYESNGQSYDYIRENFDNTNMFKLLKSPASNTTISRRTRMKKIMEAIIKDRTSRLPQ